MEKHPHPSREARVDVVWFNEMLDPDLIQQASEASQASEVFFSIGTSSVVYPAASLPFEALAHGARLVEINPATTPLTQEAQLVVHGPAGQVLPALVRAVWPEG